MDAYGHWPTGAVNPRTADIGTIDSMSRDSLVDAGHSKRIRRPSHHRVHPATCR